MNQTLIELSEGRMKAFNFLNFFLAICTFYLSFEGLTVESEDFMEHGLATVLAFASAVAVYAIWHFAFKLIPFKKKRYDIIGSWFSMIVAISGIVGLSSFQNATGAAGLEATESYTQLWVRNATDSFQDSYNDAKTLAVVGNIARSATIKYSGLRDDEFRSGLFSQAGGGPGAVHSSLTTITSNVDQLERDAAGFDMALAGYYKAGSAVLEEMRRILLLDEPFAERTRLLEAQSLKLSKIQTDMNPRFLAESIQQIAQSLPDEIDINGIRYSQRADTARLQREAITRLINDVERTRDDLINVARPILASERAVFKQFEPVSPSRAVRIMWKDFFPHWVAAITIDCIWLPILIWVSLTASGKSDEDIAIARVLSIRLGTLIDAQTANDLLGERGLSELRGIQKIRRANMGECIETRGDDHA